MSAIDASMGEALLAAAGEVAVYTPPLQSPVSTRAYIAWATIERPNNYGSQITEMALIAWLPATAAPDPRLLGTIAIGAATYIAESLHAANPAVIGFVVRRQ